LKKLDEKKGFPKKQGLKRNFPGSLRMKKVNKALSSNRKKRGQRVPAETSSLRNLSWAKRLYKRVNALSEGKKTGGKEGGKSLSSLREQG